MNKKIWNEAKVGLSKIITEGFWDIGKFSDFDKLGKFVANQVRKNEDLLDEGEELIVKIKYKGSKFEVASGFN